MPPISRRWRRRPVAAPQNGQGPKDEDCEMRLWDILLLTTIVASCASAPVAPTRVDLLNDRLFQAPSERIVASDIFALSNEMTRYLQSEIAGQIRDNGLHRGFFNALYTKGQLQLEYDSARTRTAAEAFADRSGNCLSLVIMTAAFAKALDIPVWYQSVTADETWSRSGDVQYFIGHVNLRLGKRQSDIGIGHPQLDAMTIDFLPPQATRGASVNVVSEQTIVAMFMNNRAAEALADGKVDDAYWWARTAIGADPLFVSAYNTLGVVYLRHGNPEEATKALAYANQRDPGNTRVMYNLITVLKATGHAAEAGNLARKLEALDPNPPFSYFTLGLKAMKDEDYRLARDLFEKEIRREPYYHEFHYWLAVAYASLGEVEPARKQLAIALEYSTTRKEHDLYSAKLARINAARAQ
jgi:tetratricopeptide (TPR) repeat protein